MEKLKTGVILVMVIIIVILSLLKSCESKPVKKEVTVKTDTIVKIIPAPDTIIKFKTKYFPKWDTVLVFKDSSKWSKNLCNFERQYNDSTSDSNVTIYSHIETIGLLKSSQFSYKLKVPLRIETTIKTDSIYKEVVRNKVNFMIIGGVGGNNTQFDATIGAAITKKNAYYGYEYGVASKTHNIKIGFILFKSKK